MLNINREQLAWAAGLFEGEGCFSIDQNQPRVILNTTDLDVLERFCKVVGEIGRIYGPRKNKTHKDLWSWSVTGFEKTQAIVAMLWPWLGDRRRNKATEILKSHIFKGRVGSEAAVCGRLAKKLGWKNYVVKNGVLKKLD